MMGLSVNKLTAHQAKVSVSVSRHQMHPTDKYDKYEMTERNGLIFWEMLAVP